MVTANNNRRLMQLESVISTEPDISFPLEYYYLSNEQREEWLKAIKLAFKAGAIPKATRESFYEAVNYDVTR